MRFALVATVAAWAAWSMLEFPPLDDPMPVESGSAFMIIFGVPTVWHSLQPRVPSHRATPTQPLRQPVDRRRVGVQ